MCACTDEVSCDALETSHLIFFWIIEMHISPLYESVHVVHCRWGEY